MVSQWQHDRQKECRRKLTGGGSQHSTDSSGSNSQSMPRSRTGSTDPARRGCGRSNTKCRNTRVHSKTPMATPIQENTGRGTTSRGRSRFILQPRRSKQEAQVLGGVVSHTGMLLSLLPMLITTSAYFEGRQVKLPRATAEACREHLPKSNEAVHGNRIDNVISACVLSAWMPIP